MNDKQEAEQQHEVRIHIDQKPYKSPTPTTGEALYTLGNVHQGHALYKEVEGDAEDQLIPRDATMVHLTMDEHFHSGPKEITIIVNGRQKMVEVRRLSFNEIVGLAFNPVPTGPNILFTITYRSGPHQNPSGTLMSGASVKIKNGMIFNVTATDKS